MDGKLNKRQLQYNQTLSAIRKAVDELVAEIGYDNMRIKDIANRVGISEGAFYHYFASKDDILLDRNVQGKLLLEQDYQEKWKNMHEIDAIKQYVQTGAERQIQAHPDMLIPYQRARLLHYAEWNEKAPDQVYSILQTLVEKGQNSGHIQTRYSQQQIVSMIVTSIEGMCFSHCKTRNTADTQNTLPLLLDWIESLRA